MEGMLGGGASDPALEDTQVKMAFPAEASAKKSA
jgi:hypothetical protein